MEQREENRTRSHEHRRSLIGFLTVEPTYDQIGLIGAMLVLDDKGYPLEFRCTTAVRPTTIQRTLYGSLLKPYVSVELCGKRLLAEVQRKPALIVTSSLDLLALSEGEIPIVAVLRAGEVIETESLAKDIERERLESAPGRFQPVILMTRQDQQQEVNEVKEILNNMFHNFDLVEPFERIRTALKALAESDPKYR
ncbi:hypothetical protein M1M86_00615 [Dehalococcoidales bacterium]|nr:hypothetical protein [Dehalococcoidales bacterium]